MSSSSPSSSVLSALTVTGAAARIGDAQHCQAGGTIALSAALAAALAQATANVTLVEQPTDTMRAAALHMQTVMGQTRTTCLRLADQDADAITEFVALRERGQALRGYELLCDGPREVADMAIKAARAMQAFRAQVCERSRDDLEFALTLMCAAGLAAMQLLDSNLRIWPLPDLRARYEPHVARLVHDLDTLRPVKRIRV